MPLVQENTHESSITPYCLPSTALLPAWPCSHLDFCSPYNHHQLLKHKTTNGYGKSKIIRTQMIKSKSGLWSCPNPDCCLTLRESVPIISASVHGIDLAHKLYMLLVKVYSIIPISYSLYAPCTFPLYASH